jgi:hypothetical protein
VIAIGKESNAVAIRGELATVLGHQAGIGEGASPATGPDVRRLTGVAGLALVLLALGQFPLYMQGDPSVSTYDGAALGRELFRIQNVVFTRILLDIGLYIAAMIFAAGLSQLIKRARPGYEWLGSLVFGSMAVWIGVTLVANGLEGAAVLDTLGGRADPSVIRALWEATLLIYNGSIAFGTTGLFLAAAGYATFATRVLPRWTGWLACVGAALCAVAVPAMYGGAVDYTGLYNAGGWGPVVIANFPPALWFIAASVALLRTPRQNTAVLQEPRANGTLVRP